MGELDKEKAMGRQKMEQISRDLRDLEERLRREIEDRNNEINEMQSEHGT